MNRIEILRDYIDEILVKNYNEARRGFYIHLYGVSQFCALIALKRNQNAELATMAGMLHDIHTFKNLDSTEHAKKGAILAREILTELGITTEEETDLICEAIQYHSKKKNTYSDFTEVLIDADVMEHHLYNIRLPLFEKDVERLKKLKKEFNLN